MYYSWLMAIPVAGILVFIYAIFRYRLHTGQLLLKEEEKFLAGQFALIQKEQKEMSDFKAQIVEELHQWKKSEQEHSEQIKLFQNELLSDLEAGEDRCYWQDTLLNLTFLHKLDECRAQGIEITLEGFPQEGMPAPKAGHTELTSLMINLFDNAREACQLIPEIEDRRIRIEVRKARGRLFFSMENSCNERSRKRFGTNTWKKDSEEHGIGLDIITDLVNSMNGRIKSTRREDVYQVELILPVEKAA